MVLAAPDRVEAERADEPRLLDRLREAPRRVVGLRMLRVQVDPALQDERRVRSSIPTLSECKT
jgi:hypothetical protein